MAIYTITTYGAPSTSTTGPNTVTYIDDGVEGCYVNVNGPAVLMVHTPEIIHLIPWHRVHSVSVSRRDDVSL